MKEHPDFDRASLRAIGIGAFATDHHDLRSASLAIIERKHALLEDRDLPWLLADSMLHEKEFFIRKSIGRVLRETRMSGLTLREGAKYLSDTQRRSLGLAPWRDKEGRPFGS